MRRFVKNSIDCSDRITSYFPGHFWIHLFSEHKRCTATASSLDYRLLPEGAGTVCIHTERSVYKCLMRLSRTVACVSVADCRLGTNHT